MLTSITIRNFKKLQDVSFELGNAVVFIGPNNSGKTSALQALSLWSVGLSLWKDKRGISEAKKRPGVTINRRDLTAMPVPAANLLWKELHTREVTRSNGSQKTSNIRIEIIVRGESLGGEWECGLEFDYANEESFYVRPMRLSSESDSERMPVPDIATAFNMAYLPPMSGLAAEEPVLEAGRIDVLIGQGQTAQVLRNVCFLLFVKDKALWQQLTDRIYELFAITLLVPERIEQRGEVRLSYKDRGKNILYDISSSGRGVQQTILLLSYLYLHPKSVLLLDEPDAHLEVLRQRQIYSLLTETAKIQNSQIIVASHSEIILNEAADKDIVIAFVGSPHRMNDRGSQVIKSLNSIGFDQYYHAEQTGWVLYLEGATDLSILQAFATLVEHPASSTLSRPFVSYIGSNEPQRARNHFYGLREAKNDLVGIAIFDSLQKALEEHTPLVEKMWKKREIENYFNFEYVLIAYAYGFPADDLFEPVDADHRANTMRQCIREFEAGLKITKGVSPWSDQIKATDEFLDRLFDMYFDRLGEPNIMRKTNYHQLVRFVKAEDIHPDIIEMLDCIVEVASNAKPYC